VVGCGGALGGLPLSRRVGFVLKPIDSLAKLLEGIFDDGQLCSVVRLRGVAPLGRGGTNEGFNDVIVGEVE